MSTPSQQRMDASEWALLVTLSVLWGGSFFFAEVALADLPPLTVVLGRVGLAALTLNLLILPSGRRLPRPGAAWLPFLAMGALNSAIPFALIVWSQTRIGSGLAAILNATTPLFGIVVAHALTGDDRLSRNRLTGLLFGLASGGVMVGPAARDGLDGGVAAQFAILAAACSYAFAGVFGRRFHGLPPILPAAGQVTGSTLLILPAALLVDRPRTLAPPPPAAWGAVLGLALLCTALAYVIYFRILAAAGATNLLLVTFLIPVSAHLLGTGLLAERLAPRQLLGIALIVAGLAAIDGRPLACLRRRLAGAPHAVGATLATSDRDAAI